MMANDQWEPVTETFDGALMAMVPPGCFIAGSTAEQEGYAADELFDVRSWYENEQPAHEQCLDELFWIDVYQVTNEQYGLLRRIPSDDPPRETADWFEASVHCESRGSRLTTKAEWEYAARGPDGLICPWGNEFDTMLANFCAVETPCCRY